MNKIITLIAMTAISSAAHADRRRAARLFAAGLQAYEKGDYLTAVRAFEQSQEERRHPDTLFAMAQAYRRQYELAHDPPTASKAAELYRQFVKVAPRSPWAGTAQAHLVQLLAILARRSEAAQQRQAAPPPVTQLMVSSQTPGARASIDGEPPGGEPVAAIRVVTPGPHRVRVFAPGHTPAEQTVQAVDKQLVVSTLDLTPAPGRLRVAANTDGATVYIDGKAAGRTPFEQRELAPGKHTVAVVDRGRKLWSRVVEVEPSQTASAVANLNWSAQRKLALSTGAVSVAAALAGMVTGLLALQKDSAIDSMPRTTNEERQAWTDSVGTRDRLATSSTILFSVAGAALLGCAAMYWFDSPDAPVARRAARSLPAAAAFAF